LLWKVCRCTAETLVRSRKKEGREGEGTHVSIKIGEFDSLSSKEINGRGDEGGIIVADVSPALEYENKKNKIKTKLT
jgi:hypothetical protein